MPLVSRALVIALLLLAVWLVTQIPRSDDKPPPPAAPIERVDQAQDAAATAEAVNRAREAAAAAAGE